MEEEDKNKLDSRASADDLQPSVKRLRLDSVMAASQESGLWLYAGKNKPVGIAQPFQKKESIDTEVMDDAFELKAAFRSGSDGLKGAKMSDDFGKLSFKGRGVDSDSDATSTFEFPFEQPSSSGDDDVGSQLKELTRNKAGVGGAKDMPASRGTLKLPTGKRYHLFVTHSTSDQQWAEEVVTPLSGKWKVKACYLCMPDDSCYDDKGIKDCMKQSCVILIGLSHKYLHSPRCCREWEVAVQLSYEKINVIVALVSPCSRPDPLRKFLYLDFFDRDKRKYAWEMLVKTVTGAVNGMLSHHTCPTKDHKKKNQELCVILQQLHSSGSSGRDSQNTNDLDLLHGSKEDTGHILTDFGAIWEEGKGGFEGCAGSDSSMGDSGYSITPHVGSGGKQKDECPDRDTESVEGGTPELKFLEEEFVKGEESSEDSNNGSESSEERFGNEEDVAEAGTRETCEKDANQGSEGGQQFKVHCDVEEGEVSDSDDEASRTDSQQRLDSLDSKSGDVAVFYNNLARPDVDRRNESPIKLMRNFNNWVKSILIRTYLRQCPPKSIALDICCGKGGDLLKWKEGRISHLVCADISNESITAAKDRYHSDKMAAGTRDGRPPFNADFYVADCTEECISDLASSRPSNSWSRMFFHIASCQFSVHYSFKTYRKAHMMLRNACESLRPKGFFIGTTIDADQLVRRLQTTGNSASGSLSIGNSLFTVTLDPTLDIGNLPLFGACYNFKLHDVVDLPEYLIYFPLLEKMLEDFNMEIVLRQNFYDFFAEHRYILEDNELLYRMEAFDKKTGTMSKEQWEIVGLYLVFVFRKKTVSQQ